MGAAESTTGPAPPPPQPTPFLVGLDSDLVRLATRGHSQAGASGNKEAGAVGGTRVWGVKSSESCMVSSSAEVCLGSRLDWSAGIVGAFGGVRAHSVASCGGAGRGGSVPSCPELTLGWVRGIRCSGRWCCDGAIVPGLETLGDGVSNRCVCRAGGSGLRSRVLHRLSQHAFVVRHDPYRKGSGRVGLSRGPRPHLTCCLLLPCAARKADFTGLSTTQPGANLLEVVRRMLRQVSALGVSQVKFRVRDRGGGGG